MRTSSTARVIRLLTIWLIWLLVPTLPAFQAAAFQIEFERVYGDAGASGDAKTIINILSSTDSERFHPVIAGFLELNPAITFPSVIAPTTYISTALAHD